MMPALGMMDGLKMMCGPRTAILRRFLSHRTTSPPNSRDKNGTNHDATVWAERSAMARHSRLLGARDSSLWIVDGRRRISFEGWCSFSYIHPAVATKAVPSAP